MPRNRFSEIPPSPVSMADEIARLESAGGIRVIRFDVAEPALPPPKSAINGTIEAITRGEYKYASSWGIPELRQAVSRF